MASNNPEGRPKRYENLKEMSVMRVPTQLQRELRELFTELDRLAVRQDPCEILSSFCDQLSDVEA